jgi:hypothetical protein
MAAHLAALLMDPTPHLPASVKGPSLATNIIKVANAARYAFSIRYDSPVRLARPVQCNDARSTKVHIFFDQAQDSRLWETIQWR